MKALLACGLVVCFAVLAGAQAGAPATTPTLRPAPSLTIIKAKSMIIRNGEGRVIRTGENSSIELLGPRVIEADEAEIFMGTDEAIVRGSVSIRSAVDEVVSRR
jgi:hypothetical protein